jgi:cullin-4
MSSTSKKRKTATSPSEIDITENGAEEDEVPSPKKHLSEAEAVVQGEVGELVDVSNEYDNAVVNRAPLKVSLKRIGKRGHEGVENVFKSSTDEEGRAKGHERKGAGEVAPPERKRTLLAGASQLPSSRRTPMATNLRSSLRGSNGSVGQKQVKKLVIKSSLEAPKIAEDFHTSTWEKLHKAVNSIHSGHAVDYSLEELYLGVEGLCAHNYSSEIYNKLEAEVKIHLSSQLVQLEENTTSKDDAVFLRCLNQLWTQHCDHMHLIRSIFLSLDRQIAAEASNTKAIWEMGLVNFRALIAEVPAISQRLRRGLLAAIEADRNAQVVDRSLMKSLARMYISLGMYHDDFEPVFLQESEAYYVAEASRLTQEVELQVYLAQVENRLEFEEHTIGLYLAVSSVPLLLKLLQNVLITRQLTNYIISKGLDDLMDGDKFGDLKCAYRLVTLVDAQKPLRMAWNQYIKRRGSELVNDRAKDKTMIEELLAFRSKLDRILQECFGNDGNFLYSLKDGFEGAVNSRMNAPSELLAKFLDRHLQSGSRTSSSDVEFEILFERVMSIFRSLSSKDVFEAFYRKDLAKRLLLAKSASIDAERMVLGKLKDECGAQYISKMEGMFKDIDLSKDLTAKFSESLTENPNSLINNRADIGIHVLTTGYWPTFNPTELNLPSDLAAIHQAFSDFYLKQFHARNLVWLNAHGHVTMRAFFPKGRRELSVSTLQASVLLLFNDANHISFSDIASATGIKDIDELKRTVLSLFSGQFKVILRQGETSSSSTPSTPTNEEAPTAPNNASAIERKEIADTDIFYFNEKFTSKKVRIKINQIQLKETRVEQQKTQEAVFQDRIGQVDAALVRIMKTRKTLHHNDLVTEVINILRFPFQASDLKKRIETLIDREFLARDKHDQTLYNYIP